MAATTLLHNSGQLERFTNNLWQHQQKKKFCDFTLTTNNASIECHKLVLASASSYFSRTFCDSNNAINIIDVSPLPEHILKTAVAFMYNSAYVIDDENVVELLNFSGTWNLDILCTLCVSYVNDNFNVSNACRLYSFTLDYYNMIEFQALSEFIREHFKSFHESNELRQLSLRNYIEIIDHDEINVENEDAIFSNAVQIMGQQTSGEDTRRCLELIRYPHISSDYLIEVVQAHPLMKEPPQNGYVREALKYHLNKSSTKTVKPCRTWSDVTCAYCMGPDESVYRYLTKHGKDTCTKIMQLNEWIPSGSSVKLHDRRKCIIIVDGKSITKNYTGTQIAYQSTAIKHVQLLDITNETNEPRTLPDLPVPICNPGIALSENNVYVMGGEDTESRNSMFCLSLVNEKWQEKKSMPHALFNPLALHHQYFIYVLGGRLNNGKLQSSVSKYNIKLDAWERCSDMPTSCDSGDAEVVVHQGNIKVITKNKCMAYSDNTDSWSVKCFNKLGGRVKVFVKRGQICAVVDEIDTIIIRSVMRYDDVKNKWKTEKTVYNWLQIKKECIEFIKLIYDTDYFRNLRYIIALYFLAFVLYQCRHVLVVIFQSKRF